MIKEFLCGFAAILIFGSQVSAKGGNYHTDDRYNPQHIEGLPPMVRENVLHICNSPRAMHTFATYSGNRRQLVLHYEHFYCNPHHIYCKPSGECLHQVYVSAGGHYKLMRSYYAPPGE